MGALMVTFNNIGWLLMLTGAAVMIGQLLGWLLRAAFGW